MGSALSLACNHFGLECEVYMVKVSYGQSYRRSFMKAFGANVIPSPSNLTGVWKVYIRKGSGFCYAV